MATKDNLFLFKDNHQSFVNADPHDAANHFNLNLNQTHKNLDTSLVQSFSKSSIDKQFATEKISESTVSYNDNERNEKSFNKTFMKDLCSKNSYSFNEENDTKKNKNSLIKSNNSTLSLHIAAYENSIEAAAASASSASAVDRFDERKSFKMMKDKKSAKNFKPRGFGSTSIIQNPFEFPRQQKDQAGADPEVMQFKPSQQLATPNKSGPSKKNAAPAFEALAEIEEKAENVTGWFYDNYIIIEPIDDSIKRYFGVYSLYDFNNPTETAYAYIPQPNTKRVYAEIVMNNSLTVLKKCSGRSKHFPRLKHHGLIKKLVFGMDYANEEERDPEWTNRPFIIINHEHVNLSSLFAFSENGCLPVDLTLHVGLGIALSLAALHRAGFIHRNVTPHSFSYPVPLTLELLSSRMIITDMSLCMEYPYKNGPRVSVPFVGTTRYSSIRTHQGREQGPADDYISLIYVMCEMINGKLPWRSMYEKDEILKSKIDYCNTRDLRRLPRELRKLYHDLMLKKMSWIDPEMVIEAFQASISKRDPNKSYELPKWLVMPSAN